MKILDPHGQLVPSAPLQSISLADRHPEPAPADAPIVLVRRCTEVWATGELDALDELLAADFTAHYNGSLVSGRDAWKQTMAEVRTHHTRIMYPSDDLIAEGDLVADNWTWSSIERQTGEHLIMYGVTLHRIARGRVQEQWTVTNVLTPRKQRSSPAER